MEETTLGRVLPGQTFTFGGVTFVKTSGYIKIDEDNLFRCQIEGQSAVVYIADHALVKPL